MALYENGILVSGANKLPKMTLAEYRALPASERPTYWERTDRDYNESVSVTADGVKTYATLLNELFALVDFSKVTVRTKLHRTADEILGLTLLASPTSLIFSFCYTFAANDTLICSMYVASSGSKYMTYNLGSSFTDRSASVPTSGEKITIYYD